MSLFKKRREPGTQILAGYPAAEIPTLSVLLEHGANLADPRHVLHYVYVTSPEQQSEAAEIVGAAGWEVTTPEPLPEYPEQWLVLAERRDATLTADFVTESRRFFEETATRFGGEYDGWEAAV